MLFVIPCENKRGLYNTLYNTKTGFHCHTINEKDTLKVIKAFNAIEAGRPCRGNSGIRMKALRLIIGGKTL